MCPIDIRFDLNSAYKLLDYIGNQLSNPKTCAEFKRKLKINEQDLIDGKISCLDIRFKETPNSSALYLSLFVGEQVGFIPIICICGNFFHISTADYIYMYNLIKLYDRYIDTIEETNTLYDYFINVIEKH